MTIKFIDLYNKITGQAWSMFDGEIESEEEFETTVTTSIQKALTSLYCNYKFPFRYKTYTIKTRANKNKYNTPDGNITTTTYKGETVFDIKCNGNYLEYDPNIEILENVTGVPTKFFIKNDNIVVFPIPDDSYTIEVEYLNILPAIDGETEEQKGTLEKEEDYIDLPEKYDILFKNTLLPFAMTYLIASETDENYSAYMKQYLLALDILLEYTKAISLDKIIGWK